MLTAASPRLLAPSQRQEARNRGRSLLKRIDGRALNLAADEILGFARIRNEALRLPWCLDYHRRLGVDRFFVVDNGSTDGSTDYLLSRPDVHVFSAVEPYADNQSGMNWLNALLREYAAGHWAVTVDADELLIYPGVEDLGLRSLTGYLDRSQVDALGCVMIDMYSATSIQETRYEPGEDFLKACPYFDAESPVDMRGGARRRLFWGEREEGGRSPFIRQILRTKRLLRGQRGKSPFVWKIPFVKRLLRGHRGEPPLLWKVPLVKRLLRGKRGKPPFLWKVPLVRWRRDLTYTSGTHLIEDVTLPEISGALLHFKLFWDFHQRVVAGVEGRQFWEGSAQYEAYLEGLQEEPGLTAYYEGSVRMESSEQLVDLGLMKVSAAYEAFRRDHTGL